MGLGRERFGGGGRGFGGDGSLSYMILSSMESRCSLNGFAGFVELRRCGRERMREERGGDESLEEEKMRILMGDERKPLRF